MRTRKLVTPKTDVCAVVQSNLPEIDPNTHDISHLDFQIYSSMSSDILILKLD